MLLLDEPTNHLDTDAKSWLLEFLRRYRGALLVISHDLDLLDESITRVLHLERHGDDDIGALTEYKGTYSQYLAGARPRRGSSCAGRSTVSRPRSAACPRWPSRCATRPRSGPARPSRSTRGWPSSSDAAAEGPAKRRTIRVRFPEPPAAGRTVLEVDDLARSYGPVDVFDSVDLRRRSAASACWSWGSTARARRRCCGSWPG